MAVHETERDRIVLRIVYDGPGRVGKTTNIRQLAAAFLGEHVPDPQDPPEPAGRTRYFDWFAFDGGKLDGHALTIQAISVPGHKRYEARRAHLLRSADAIVLVCDSLLKDQEQARETLDSLREHLGAHARQIPLVIQANKQDLAEALQPHEIGRELGLPHSVPILGAQASEGIGVRETAVQAVRSAVRRIKRQITRDGLPSLAGQAADAASLRRELDLLASAALPENGPPEAPPPPRSRRRGTTSRPTTVREPKAVNIRSRAPGGIIAHNHHGELASRDQGEDAAAPRDLPILQDDPALLDEPTREPPAHEPDPAPPDLSHEPAAAPTGPRRRLPSTTPTLPGVTMPPGSPTPSPLSPSTAWPESALAPTLPDMAQGTADPALPDPSATNPTRTLRDLSHLSPSSRPDDLSPETAPIELRTTLRLRDLPPRPASGAPSDLSSRPADPERAPGGSHTLIERTTGHARPLAPDESLTTLEHTLPRPDLAPGLVWPIPRGREILRALAELPVQRLPTPPRPGDDPPLLYAAGGWRLVTRPSQRFSSLDAAQAALRERARLTGPCAALLTGQLALAVAPEPDGGARLWHIAPRLDGIREHLALRPPQARPRLLAALAAAIVAALRLWLRHGVMLEQNLGAFAVESGRVVHLGDRIGVRPGELGAALLGYCERLTGDAAALASFITALEQELGDLTAEERARLELEAALTRAETRYQDVHTARSRLLAGLRT